MMEMSVITDPAHVDAHWLTRVLRESGDLEQGSVSNVELSQNESPNASCARLILRYSEDARGSKPASLFLKICKEGSTEFGTTEIDWYAKIAVPIPEGPIPKCYHSAYASTTGRYHLLLEDLSDTHHNNWGVEPTAPMACKTAVSLAKIHAYWWDHPDLLDDERYPRAPVIDRYRASIEGGIAPMLDYLGDRISQRTKDVLMRIFSEHSTRMIQRAVEGKHVTYIHSDPNPGNILTPNSPDGRVYLIDRQVIDEWLSIWTGASDLAYMMVLWWEPAIRRQLEQTVLKSYYEALTRFGVQGYSWEQLWTDYRLAVPQGTYVATDWCIDDDARSAMEWVWWPKLRRSIEAFHDLQCTELLG